MQEQNKCTTCAGLIEAYLKKRKMTMYQFAHLIERDRSTVWLWLHDKKSPNRTTRQRIFEKTNGELDLIA